GTVNA
ncbi:hypothetical protein VCEC0012_003112B, partial [Vibrio cholerae O1 str. EC-0012]